MAKAKVILGPYIAIIAAYCYLPVRFMKVEPSQTPKIDPTAKFASTMLLPSKGSKATAYFSPPKLIS